MSAQIEQEFSKMMKKHTQACVQALADKYGFDPTEAQTYLSETGPQKKSRGKSPVLAAAPAPPAELFGALLPKAEAEKPKAKAEKPKAEAEKPKAKRGPNGWHAWGKANREAVATETSLKGRDLNSEMSKRWKALSAEEQAEWKSKAGSSSEGED